MNPRKIVFAGRSGKKPTHLSLGKADDVEEEPGKSTQRTAGAGAQASEERFSA
jgi:hypothetical protein